MTVRVSVAGAVMTITGLPDVARRTVLGWLEDIAELVDARIAADFEREIAAGKRLAANKSSYEDRKTVEGLDDRRGHATGNLQNELDDGGMWTARIAGRGRATIRWDESKLQARVGYAEHFAEAKVRGGRLLVLVARDVRLAMQYLREVGANDRGTRRRAA